MGDLLQPRFLGVPPFFPDSKLIALLTVSCPPPLKVDSPADSMLFREAMSIVLGVESSLEKSGAW